MMTKVILADTALFLLYFIFSAMGIIWLKILLSIVVLIGSGCILGFLYMNKELTKPRSLWMTTAAASMMVCLIFSLILNVP